MMLPPEDELIDCSSRRKSGRRAAQSSGRKAVVSYAEGCYVVGSNGLEKNVIQEVIDSNIPRRCGEKSARIK